MLKITNSKLQISSGYQFLNSNNLVFSAWDLGFYQMHKPVLLKEAIDFLNPQPGEFFIDGTLGEGGHGHEILKKIPNGRFLALDLDNDSLKRCQEIIEAEFLTPNFQFLKFRQGNFSEIAEILKQENLPKADGIFLDLGFSSWQIEKSGKGFSFLRDEPLSMVYDKKSTPVGVLLKELNEFELAEVIKKFGEERFANRIAHSIKDYLKKNKTISTTKELTEIIKNSVPKSYERGRIHPATRTFQALRIFANDELGHLERFLGTLPDILSSNGRVVIISFHSLEDRLVKNYFRNWTKEGKLSLLTKKPIIATKEEILGNPRSRSAKLRAIKMN